MGKVYRKNDSVTVAIEDLGTEGEGIGKVDGFTLFVKDAVPGDIVEAKIVKSKKNYAYARAEKVITPSPFRVEPKCIYHRQCGGCQLQALSYEKQLEFKQRKIRNNLIRIGGFSPEYIDERMEPVIGMEEPFYYRNKAQYPVGTDRYGNVITGFYAGRTHSIIANTECHLGVSENKEILEVILKHMRRYNVSAYDETTGKGLVRHILIRKGFTSGEIMVCLVINKTSCGRSLKPSACSMAKMKINTDTLAFDPVSEQAEFIPEQNVLLEKLIAIKGMTSVSVSINTERTNVIMGKEIYTLWGSPVISDTIHVRDMQKEGYPVTGKALTFHISPLSFYQVNPVQTEKLYSLALEYAGLTGEETVWDLYCGIGTISLFLAGGARKVYGVEVIPQAIEDARENAKRNGIRNAEFFVGKAEEILTGIYERGAGRGEIEIGKAEAKGNEDIKKEAKEIEIEIVKEGAKEIKVVKAAAIEMETGKAGIRNTGMTDIDAESSPTILKKERCAGMINKSESDLNTDMLHPDVIVVDPPRKGCDESCLFTMLKMKPKRIVYVSCDSATLARDLKVLCGGGYEIAKVRGVDQFGMTVHVETVACLQKVDM